MEQLKRYINQLHLILGRLLSKEDFAELTDWLVQNPQVTKEEDLKNMEDLPYILEFLFKGDKP